MLLISIMCHMQLTRERQQYSSNEVNVSCDDNVLQKQMDTYTSECYDSIALFLCIHIIHRYKVLMHKRNVPVLDK